MSLNNVEEVGTSLPDVQFSEIQILEEENNAKRATNRTSAWVFSCKFAAYFQNTFS